MADHPPPTLDTAARPDATFFYSHLPHAPALPNALRKAHGAFISTDTRFAASARILASLWRADQGLPAGIHVARGTDGKTRRVRAGYRLRPDAARAGATFLDPATHAFVRRALVLREPGSAWDFPKITGHLLSSQGLLLNLLAPLAADRDLATAVFQRLLPDFVHSVTGIVFETAPARDDPSWLGDGTAWDARLDIITPDGEPGFIAVESKFIEAMAGPAASHRPRYAEVARASGLFVDPNAPALYRPGLEQLRRQHTLAGLMLNRGLASRAHLVLLGPALNPRVGTVAQAYAAHLVDPTGQAGRIGFSHLTLEAVLAAFVSAGATDMARAFHARYLDFDRVAALALATGGAEPRPPSSAPNGQAVPLLLPPPKPQAEAVSADSPIAVPSSHPRRRTLVRRRRTSPPPTTRTSPKPQHASRRPRRAKTSAPARGDSTARHATPTASSEGR